MARVPAAITLSGPYMRDGTAYVDVRVKSWAQVAIHGCLLVLKTLVIANVLTADEAVEKGQRFTRWLLSLRDETACSHGLSGSTEAWHG